MAKPYLDKEVEELENSGEFKKLSATLKAKILHFVKRENTADYNTHKKFEHYFDDGKTSLFTDKTTNVKFRESPIGKRFVIFHEETKRYFEGKDDDDVIDFDHLPVVSSVPPASPADAAAGGGRGGARRSLFTSVPTAATTTTTTTPNKIYTRIPVFEGATRRCIMGYPLEYITVKDSLNSTEKILGLAFSTHEFTETVVIPGQMPDIQLFRHQNKPIRIAQINPSKYEYVDSNASTDQLNKDIKKLNDYYKRTSTGLKQVQLPLMDPFNPNKPLKYDNFEIIEVREAKLSPTGIWPDLNAVPVSILGQERLKWIRERSDQVVLLKIDPSKPGGDPVVLTHNGSENGKRVYFNEKAPNTFFQDQFTFDLSNVKGVFYFDDEMDPLAFHWRYLSKVRGDRVFGVQNVIQEEDEEDLKEASNIESEFIMPLKKIVEDLEKVTGGRNIEEFKNVRVALLSEKNKTLDSGHWSSMTREASVVRRETQNRKRRFRQWITLEPNAKKPNWMVQSIGYAANTIDVVDKWVSVFPVVKGGIQLMCRTALVFSYFMYPIGGAPWYVALGRLGYNLSQNYKLGATKEAIALVGCALDFECPKEDGYHKTIVNMFGMIAANACTKEQLTNEKERMDFEERKNAYGKERSWKDAEEEASRKSKNGSFVDFESSMKFFTDLSSGTVATGIVLAVGGVVGANYTYKYYRSRKEAKAAGAQITEVDEEDQPSVPPVPSVTVVEEDDDDDDRAPLSKKKNRYDPNHVPEKPPLWQTVRDETGKVLAVVVIRDLVNRLTNYLNYIKLSDKEILTWLVEIAILLETFFSGSFNEMVTEGFQFVGGVGYVQGKLGGLPVLGAAAVKVDKDWVKRAPDIIKSILSVFAAIVGRLLQENKAKNPSLPPVDVNKIADGVGLAFLKEYPDQIGWAGTFVGFLAMYNLKYDMFKEGTDFKAGLGILAAAVGSTVFTKVGSREFAKILPANRSRYMLAALPALMGFAWYSRATDFGLEIIGLGQFLISFFRLSNIGEPWISWFQALFQAGNNMVMLTPLLKRFKVEEGQYNSVSEMVTALLPPFLFAQLSRETIWTLLNEKGGASIPLWTASKETAQLSIQPLQTTHDMAKSNRIQLITQRKEIDVVKAQLDRVMKQFGVIEGIEVIEQPSLKGLITQWKIYNDVDAADIYAKLAAAIVPMDMLLEKLGNFDMIDPLLERLKTNPNTPDFIQLLELINKWEYAFLAIENENFKKCDYSAYATIMKEVASVCYQFKKQLERYKSETDVAMKSASANAAKEVEAKKAAVSMNFVTPVATTTTTTTTAVVPVGPARVTTHDDIAGTLFGEGAPLMTMYSVASLMSSSYRIGTSLIYPTSTNESILLRGNNDTDKGMFFDQNCDPEEAINIMTQVRPGAFPGLFEKNVLDKWQFISEDRRLQMKKSFISMLNSSMLYGYWPKQDRPKFYIQVYLMFLVYKFHITENGYFPLPKQYSSEKEFDDKYQSFFTNAFLVAEVPEEYKNPTGDREANGKNRLSFFCLYPGNGAPEDDSHGTGKRYEFANWGKEVELPKF